MSSPVRQAHLRGRRVTRGPRILPTARLTIGNLVWIDDELWEVGAELSAWEFCDGIGEACYEVSWDGAE